MKLVVISGRSGSGKSTALQALEDVGFYCIDNLPARLLPELTRQMLSDPEQPAQLAVSIDARNLISNLRDFPQLIEQLSTQAAISSEILYLDADEATLLKRYSATRRKHPLSDSQAGLQQAIAYEGKLLEPIATRAALRIDTSHMTLYELRDSVKLRVAQRAEQALSLQFESFGFKHGVPLDVDFTFDVRMLPNPHWEPELRPLTGRDSAVIHYLENSADVTLLVDDIRQFLTRWIPHFQRNNRSYLTVGIGCTGGQHRSVYVCEQLAGHFSRLMDNVHVRHRELN